MAALATIFSFLAAAASAPAATPGAARTILTTDLFAPPADPDDHYDLAVAMSSTRFRPELVVIDRSRDPAGRAGRESVEELWRIAGGPRPRVALGHEISRQIAFLRASPWRSVRVVTLGALTSLAALMRRAPALVREKVASVTVFAGDASPGSPVEHNVSLDPAAFVTVMTSELPIRWAPCFDGGPWRAGTSTFTATRDDFLLAGAGSRIADWFTRHIGHRFGIRNLWAAGLLSGESPRGARWRSVEARFSTEGATVAGIGYRARVRRLVVFDRAAFEAWMAGAVRRALARLGARADSPQAPRSAKSN